MAETVPAYRDTAHGRLYRPLPELAQGGVLFLAFFATLAMGWPIGLAFGALSEAGEIGVHVPFVAVFFLGYATWAARLHALAFTFLGRWIWSVLFQVIVRRKKPEGFDDIRPTPERMEELAVRAQLAGGAFAWAGWLVSVPAALLSMLIDAEVGLVVRAGTMGLACGLFGQALAWLARRGYLPMMEGE